MLCMLVVSNSVYAFTVIPSTTELYNALAATLNWF